MRALARRSHAQKPTAACIANLESAARCDRRLPPLAAPGGMRSSHVKRNALRTWARPHKGPGYSSVAACMTVDTSMDQAGDKRAAKETPRGGARTVGMSIVAALFRMHASFGCDVTTKARQLLLLVDARLLPPCRECTCEQRAGPRAVNHMRPGWLSACKARRHAACRHAQRGSACECARQ